MPTSVTIYCYENINKKKFFKDITFDYEIDIDENSDLSINGFGKIRIKNKNTINLSNLDKSLISINNSIMGGKNE